MRSPRLGKATLSVCALVLILPALSRAGEAPSPPPAEFLPQGTFFYIHVDRWEAWSEAWKETSLRQICGEPEIKAFLAGPLQQLDKLLDKAFSADGAEAPPPAAGQPAEGSAFDRICAKLNSTIPGPATVILKYSAADQQAQRMPSGALVLGSADISKMTMENIEEFLKAAVPQDTGLSPDLIIQQCQLTAKMILNIIHAKTGQGIASEQYAGARLWVLKTDQLSFTFTVHQGRMILSSSKELCQEILDGLAGTLAAKLALDPTYKSCGLAGGEHLAAYLDVKTLREALKLRREDGRMDELLARAGAKNVRALAWSLRMNGPAFESRTALVNAGPREGLMAMLSDEPLAAGALTPCRADAPFAVALKVKREHQLALIRELIRMEAGPMAGERFIELEKKLAAELKDLKAMLAEAFSGEVVITELNERSAPPGALETTVIALGLRDAAKADALMLDLMKRAVAMRDPAPKWEDVFKETQHGGAKIRVLTPPTGYTGLAPVYAFTGERLLIGRDMQVLKAAIDGLGTPALDGAEAFKAGLAATGGKLGSMVFYHDRQQQFAGMYDLGARALKWASVFGPVRGFVDVNMLPSLGAVNKHLFPSMTQVEASGDALILSSRSPLPSPEVLVPPLVASAAVIAGFIPKPEPKPEPAPAAPEGEKAAPK